MHDAATQIVKIVDIALLCQSRVFVFPKLHKSALPMKIDHVNRVTNFSVEVIATEWLKDAIAGIVKQIKSLPSSLVPLGLCEGCLVIRVSMPRIVRLVLAMFWN
jgi:hypothetical protein